MTEIPWYSDARINEKIEWYDEHYLRIPDKKLIAAGMKIDNRNRIINLR
jgi:hypothetical protein